MTSRVIDLGAGGNPDPRADETVDLHHPRADHHFDLTDDWPLKSTSVSHFTAHHVVEHLPDTTHFFQEASRCLIDTGHLTITVPLGINADSDPDHVHQWTYDTPEIVIGDFGPERYWDPSIPMTLVDRTIDVHLTGPLRPLSRIYQYYAAKYPTWGVHNCDHGTLKATYQREVRD